MDQIVNGLTLLIKYLPSILAVLTAILQAISPETVTSTITEHPIATGITGAGAVLAAQLTRSPIKDNAQS